MPGEEESSSERARQARSSLSPRQSPRGTPASRRSSGSRASFPGRFAKRALSPPAQPEGARVLRGPRSPLPGRPGSRHAGRARRALQKVSSGRGQRAGAQPGPAREGGAPVRGRRRDPVGHPLPVSKLSRAAYLCSAALRGASLTGRSRGAGGAGFTQMSDGGACAVSRPPRGFTALFPRFDALPPSRPADEVMPEPSRGWATWILRQRVCVAGPERVAKGRELRRLLADCGVGADAFSETGSQERRGTGLNRQFVYRSELQAGGWGGRESCPQPGGTAEAAPSIWLSSRTSPTPPTSRRSHLRDPHCA